ncbi:MAG: NAD-dependent epimerase/dehydratase family protein [Nitrospirales bacterium]
MSCIVITGATGFIGSALAGAFLANGHRVICLSRNDPNGERTRQKIIEAMRGFGFDVSPHVLANLSIEQINTTQFVEDLNRCSFWKNVEQVWHCAADLTYSAQNLADSYEYNVRNSVLLYQKFSEHRACSKRFYYMSTAYVAGNVGADIDEALHLTPVLGNSYQITKFTTEQTLSLAAQQGNPLTIVRPSIVIGHQKTGWSNFKPYGLYMFARGFYKLAKLTTEIRLPIPVEAATNLVSIDTVITQAQRLSEATTNRQHQEVFHLVSAENLHTRTLLTTVAEQIGLTLQYEPAQSLLERKLEKFIEPNRLYSTQTWNFQIHKLRALLQDHPEAFASVDAHSLASIIKIYYAHLHSKERKKQSSSVHRSVTQSHQNNPEDKRLPHHHEEQIA